MNKYQEAIKRVELDFEDRVEEDNILMVGRMDIEALQELVDKAERYGGVLYAIKEIFDQDQDKENVYCYYDIRQLIADWYEEEVIK